jgi:hypothetical protein
MRRGLPLLVRLAQQDTDERRGDLSQIARASAEASKALNEHDTRVANEADSALTNPDALAALASWAPHASRNRSPLLQRASELDRSETTAREALRDAVSRTKRLELALDAIRAEHRRTTTRRNEQQADERELARQTTGGLSSG